ncbi:MAG TPA: IS200/IS605 family transposase [Coleofasciculaceae cyanobacterium]
MKKDIYRREKSSISKINLHLVFVAKYRKKLFTKEILDSMKIVMFGVAKKMNFKILEIEGETDYVHLLIEIPPKLSVSQIVNALKGVSSRMLRKNYPELSKYKSLWSPSYFAISCGGAPIDAIEKYIQNQSTPEGAG